MIICYLVTVISDKDEEGLFVGRLRLFLFPPKKTIASFSLPLSLLQACKLVNYYYFSFFKLILEKYLNTLICTYEMFKSNITSKCKLWLEAQYFFSLS